MAENVALAEAMKPIATVTEDLVSTAAEKEKARNAIYDEYDKAAATEPLGELRAKYDIAETAFTRAAVDMEDKLTDWIGRLFSADPAKPKPVQALLNERVQVQTRLDAKLGRRERDRAIAGTNAKRWADRYAEWSSPASKLSALIGEYVAKIDKLNADINNNVNRDLNMFVFWFEVAPKHLQIRPEPLDPVKDAKLIGLLTQLKGALTTYQDLALRLELGKDRDDGSLYLIDPGEKKPGETSKERLLHKKRLEVLDRWKAAAVKQGTAEAAYKLRPDDAASLRPRWDKLKDDGWQKDAAALLQTTGA